MGIQERKERERNRRKEEIILAAEKVFYSRGFGKATMDDVAEQAELSKGTLYLYFKNKSDLHLAVVLKATAILNEQVKGLSDSGKSGLEKLVALGKGFIRFSREYPNEMSAITELQGLAPGAISMPQAELREILLTQTPVKLVLDFIRQGIAENTIRKDIPPLVIAHTLWLQFLSVVQISINKKGLFEMIEFTPEQLFESHIEIVLNGIRS